jgi:hypothetical protein
MKATMTRRFHSTGPRTEETFEGSCVARAIANATRMDHAAIFVELEKRCPPIRRPDPLDNPFEYVPLHPAYGVPDRLWMPFIKELGFEFAGWGRPPSSGTFLVLQPGHLTCVIDGVFHDAWNCSRCRCLWYYCLDWRAP